MEKNGTPASPATARASSVLPVPGGPTSSTPLGILAPIAWKRSGVLEELLDLLQLLDGLVGPGHVGEGDRGLVLGRTGGPWTGRSASPPTRPHRDDEVDEDAAMTRIGSNVMSRRATTVAWRCRSRADAGVERFG
jgi:hypothetical protein